MKLKKLKKILACFSFVLAVTFVSTAQVNIYVSTSGNDANNGLSVATAFKTIESARDAIRNHPAKATNNFKVLIKGGDYFLSKIIEFTAADGGMNGKTVTYTAFNAEPVTISGGKIISNWVQEKGKPYWKAKVPFDAFRQLYVNGKRKQRARSKIITGYNSIEPNVEQKSISGYIVNANDVPPLPYNNVKDMEIHQQLEWIDSHFSITEITTSVSGKIAITAPEINRIFARGPNAYATFYVENAMELLDEPGEWYCNKATGTVYYYPEVGEKIATATTVIPVTEQLIRVEGTKNAPVKNLTFSNLQFEYAGWSAPNNIGRTGTQSNITYIPEAGLVKSHFYTEHTDNLTITGCSFQHLAAVALELRNGSQYSNIIGNKFTDIGDAAISISSPQHNFIDLPTENGNDYITIANNAIYAAGREHYGAVAIMAFYVKGIKIEHNEILDAPYTGISLGWGFQSQPTSTTCRDNIIRHNKIGFFMTRMEDGAGFYSLGQQPNSFCDSNYFYNGIANHAIYYDQGSQHSTVCGNVINNCPNWLKINGPKSDTLKFDGNFTTSKKMLSSKAGKIVSVTNTEFSTDGITLPAGAQTIIDAAGIQPFYSSVKSIFPVKNVKCVPVIAGINSTYTIGLHLTLNLVAMVSKGSNPAGSIAYTWHQKTGPAFITFTNHRLNRNELSFYKPGTYTVALEVIDGLEKVTKTIKIDVTNYNFGKNVAVGKWAKSSTDYDKNLTADKAVDNNPSTIWHPDYVQLFKQRSWWQIDLAASKKIKRIELVTRQSNPFDAARRNFQILASNDSTFATYEVLGGIGADSLPYKATAVFNVTVPSAYRFYRVRKIFLENLIIAEFAMYEETSKDLGYSTPVSPSLTSPLSKTNAIPNTANNVLYVDIKKKYEKK